MPTPSPIIAASSSEKFAVSRTCVPRPIRPAPVPSPKSAVTTGSPMARNEPKLTSSTTIAASTPIPVSEPGGATSVCWIAGPPSSTCRSGARAASAVEITFLIAPVGRRFARWSKSTIAKPVLPSAEIWPLVPAP